MPTDHKKRKFLYQCKAKRLNLVQKSQKCVHPRHAKKRLSSNHKLFLSRKNDVIEPSFGLNEVARTILCIVKGWRAIFPYFWLHFLKNMGWFALAALSLYLWYKVPVWTTRAVFDHAMIIVSGVSLILLFQAACETLWYRHLARPFDVSDQTAWHIDMPYFSLIQGVSFIIYLCVTLLGVVFFLSGIVLDSVVALACLCLLIFSLPMLEGIKKALCADRVVHHDSVYQAVCRVGKNIYHHPVSFLCLSFVGVFLYGLCIVLCLLVDRAMLVETPLASQEGLVSFFMFCMNVMTTMLSIVWPGLWIGFTQCLHHTTKMRACE